MQLKIEKLDHQGRGIVHYLDGVIFIPNALEDEVVEATVFKEKKNIYLGRVDKYLKESPRRVKPICPYYDLCGGCNIMHMSYEDQIKFKENKVREILTKFAGIDTNLIKKVIKSDNPLFYRNKATFKVAENKIGFLKRHSNEVIDIAKCFILEPKINEKLSSLKSNLKEAKEIMIRTNYKGDILTSFDGKNMGSIVEKIGDKKFKVSASAFFQVNSLQVLKLYEEVKRMANLKGSEVVFDLYCGTGSIGIYLGNLAKKVIGIEIQKEAIIDAKENARLNNLSNTEFLVGDAGKIMDTLNEKADIVIVDPPRAGLTKKAKETLIKFKPRKIIYVSCDPVTLARDLKEMSANYEVLEISLVDMFPQTSHIETVSLLQKIE